MAPDPTPRKVWLWLALALWLIPCLVISVRVGTRPLKRTVTPLYHASVERWQQRQPLYDGPTGMNYLPTFVPLFTPYHALPLPLAEVLWRWTAMAGLAIGLWGFVRLAQGEPHREHGCIKLQFGGALERGGDSLSPPYRPNTTGDEPSPSRKLELEVAPRRERPDRAFTVVSLLGVPLCLAALNNGQANAHLGVALLLAALCLATDKLWGAAMLIALAVAIKPLGVAAAGLAVLCFPRLCWRLGVALLLVFSIPFLLAPWPYVQSQFVAAFQNLRQCSEVTEHRFADLNGLLRTFGLPLGGQSSMCVRAGAGVFLAGFCLGWVRRLPPPERALAWLASAGCYLMLFNPMTETNSYAVFGPPVALWAWQFFRLGQKQLAWVLAAMLVTMELLPTVLRPWLGNYFSLAWYPAMAILFLAILVLQFCRRKPLERVSEPVPL